MPDLLIELLSEEIPARMQAKAASDLKTMVTNGLVEAGLTYSAAESFATPRRLTLAVEGLPKMSQPAREERKGPRVGAPEAALEGFLRSTGLSRDDLEQRSDKKGDVWFAVIEKPGVPTSEIVSATLLKTIETFPWPKSMRWGSDNLRWVRPLRSILCLLTDEDAAEVVDVKVGGLTSGATTEGHRFLAPGLISVSNFNDYSAKLKAAKVLLKSDERQEQIWRDVETLCFANGLEAIEDKGLLAEVAGLVEWPVTMLGRIADEFLSLPPEVLQTSMREHQKFFSVREKGGDAIVRFVTVANTESEDGGATIMAGNEKVLSARLADAKFFWENDLREAEGNRMETWRAGLSAMTFHNRLGSVADRMERVAERSALIAEALGYDAAQARTAALLVKADLASQMVYEFPELQGIMGHYYARAAGYPEDIARACEDHYAPLGPSDSVPVAPISIAVALADKLELLTSFWSIGEKPTGSKDPFALRRAALGVIRIILENDLSLRLGEHLDGDADLLGFLHDRAKVLLRDSGVSHDVIDACLSADGADDLRLLVLRAKALAQILQTENGRDLVQGFKRANNLLRQAEEQDGVSYEYGADPKYFEHAAEHELFKHLSAADTEISALLKAEDYEAAATVMAGLRAPIDAFFDAVQINSDNAIVRRNRLNLLHSIRSICLQVADLSRIEG